MRGENLRQIDAERLQLPLHLLRPASIRRRTRRARVQDAADGDIVVQCSAGAGLAKFADAENECG